MMIKLILVFLCFAVGYFGTVGILTAFHLLKQYKKVEKLEEKMERTNQDINDLSRSVVLLSKQVARLGDDKKQ